jgi:hypothetical protein
MKMIELGSSSLGVYQNEERGRGRSRAAGRRVAGVLGVAMTLSLVACGGDAGGRDSVRQVAEPLWKYSRPSLNTVLWPNGIVPLCWDSTLTSNASYAARSAMVLEILGDHWTRHGNVQFEDAGPCPASAPGAVRVKWSGNSEDSGGHAGLGYNPEAYDPVSYPGGKSGAELFFPAAKNAALQGTVLHEFGHVLGFPHEFERSDFTTANLPSDGSGTFPAGTQCDAIESAGGTPKIERTDYTTLDFDSIMAASYCHWKRVLSARDKSGIAAAYGTPGAQRYNAYIRDTGNDVRTNWWTGSTWSWFRLSTTDSANAGSAITFRPTDRNQVWVFSNTPTGGLLAHWFDGFNWAAPTVWTDRTLTSTPVGVVYRDYGKAANGKFAESPTKLRVFSTTLSGLVSRYWNGSTWSWEDFGQPPGANAMAVGGAVSFRDWGLTEESFYVFVRTTSNKLYLRWGTTGSPTTWTNELAPGGTGGGSPGTAISFLGPSNQREIWYWTTDNGSLWSYHWNGSAWAWKNHGNPGVNVSGSLSAITWTESGWRMQAIFTVDSNGNLQELRRSGNSSEGWVSHTKPNGVASVEGPSATVFRLPGTPPDAFSLTPVSIGRHIFVRGSDGKLWVRYTVDSGFNWYWADQTTPYSGPTVKTSLYPTTSAITYWSR